MDKRSGSRIRELCLFKINDFLCGLDIREIQEISIQHHLTPVHGADHFILGVANLRGTIVTVIDLRTKFGLPDSSHEDESKQILIVDDHGEKAGLLVDEVETVIPVDPKSFESSISNTSNIPKKFFSGVYKLEGDLVALLNLEEILKPTKAVEFA